MSDNDTFSDEPVVGHSVTAEIEEPESELSEALDAAADELGLTRRDHRHVTIMEYDVAWDQPQTMTIPIETFESLCRWFQQTTDD
jgi:hypothetical protein